MPNPYFSGRIPPELMKSIEEFRVKSGQSKTEVLIAALSIYVGYQDNNNNDNVVDDNSEVIEELKRFKDSMLVRNLPGRLSSIERDLEYLKKIVEN